MQHSLNDHSKIHMQHSLIDHSNVHTCKQSLNDHSIRHMQHLFITDAYTPLVIRHSATYTKMSATYTNVSLLWRLLCSNAASMSLPCFTHFFLQLSLIHI